MLRVRAASPCLIWWSTDYEGYVGFISSDYREWPISRFGRASACETAFWPPGTFIHAYDVSRRAVIEGVIEADPVATFVREIMVERSTWVGKASDLLQARLYEKNAPSRTAAWPTNPRALAARLRRCQTFLRTAGIEIAFSREGRAGCLMIRMTSLTKTCAGMTASTTGNGLAA
jgi:hypothetical protein